MKSHISIFFFLATLLAVLCISPLPTTPEEQPALPENCALCTVKEYPNLSLLDLSTGAAQELKVYNTGLYSEDLMYYVTGEFSREQPMGAMELVRCAGLEGVRFTGEYPFCQLELPSRRRSIRKSLYCRDCFALLDGLSQTGWVLLDTHGGVTPYSVNEGDDYTTPYFHVTVDRGSLIVEETIQVLEGGPYGQGTLDYDFSGLFEALFP